MSEDSEQHGYFLSALSSFVTRTCYANAGGEQLTKPHTMRLCSFRCNLSLLTAGDHLVGWANSSIRHPDKLPLIRPGTRLHGVIREEPLVAALHPQHAADVTMRTAIASASCSGSSTHHVKGGVAPDDGSLHSKHTNPTQTASQEKSAAQERQQAEDTVASSADALKVLKRLQSLPWRRTDCSFQHSKLPFFAHNHIQVTRKWLNWEGVAVCEHLAEQLAVMETNGHIQYLMKRMQNTS